MRIGFFDSGIGGLTVLYESLKQFPKADYIYYADTTHVPYGTKPKAEVKEFIFEAADFIIGQGINALVVACNTATSIAIKDLRHRYDLPIIGMEPAVKPAVEKTKSKRVLVTATPLTLKEERFNDLVSRVDSEHKVDTLPLPGLVELAEKFDFSTVNTVQYLMDQMTGLNLEEYGTVVLGCTHFTYFKKAFKEIFSPSVDIIDGNSGTVKHMKCVLCDRYPNEINSGDGKISFYSSGTREPDDSRFGKYLEYIGSFC